MVVTTEDSDEMGESGARVEPGNFGGLRCETRWLQWDVAVGEGKLLGQLTGGMGFQADQLSMFSQSP